MNDPAFREAMEEGGRPLRADAQRNRALILAAAEEVLAVHGVDASIDEIAQRAGVGVGTVYRNFPNKEALLKALVAARIEPLILAAQDLCATSGDPGEAFISFLQRLGEEFDRFKALGDTIAASGFDMQAAKKEMSGELMQALGQLLSRAQKAGRVRPDVGIQDVAMLMASLGHADAFGVDASQRTRCVALICDSLLVDARVIVPRGAAAAAPPRGPAPAPGSSGSRPQESRGDRAPS